MAPAPDAPRILIVDDEPATLVAMEAMLEDLGEIVLARSGADALRRVLEHDFAVILLDVRMPGMDGFETAKLVHGREASRTTPIIFLTADSQSSGQIRLGYAVGAIDYIAKPVVPGILRSKVAILVDLYRKTRDVERLAARLLELNSLLEEHAFVDVLTGLGNRRGFDDAVAREVGRAHRRNAPVCLVILDVDHFKEVNDTHGHPAGDEVLREVANRMRHAIRSCDAAFRIGGDEFAIVVVDTGVDGASGAAGRLLESLRANPVLLPGGTTVAVTMSAGVAQLVEPPEDVRALFARADAALYEAKRQGRDRVVAAGPVTS